MRPLGASAQGSGRRVTANIKKKKMEMILNMKSASVYFQSSLFPICFRVHKSICFFFLSSFSYCPMLACGGKLYVWEENCSSQPAIVEKQTTLVIEICE